MLWIWPSKLILKVWLDVLSFFNFRFFIARSPSKGALEFPISDTYFNFALLSLCNLLFYFQIWCRLSCIGALANLRMESEDFTKTLEQNQSMYCIWMIFLHLFRGLVMKNWENNNKVYLINMVASVEIWLWKGLVDK